MRRPDLLCGNVDVGNRAAYEGRADTPRGTHEDPVDQDCFDVLGAEGGQCAIPRWYIQAKPWPVCVRVRPESKRLKQRQGRSHHSQSDHDVQDGEDRNGDDVSPLATKFL